MKRLILLFFVLILSACRPVAATSTAIPATETPTPSSTPEPTATPTATEVPPSPTPTTEPFIICSPLEDETFNSLPLILTKGIELPAHFGQDFGHPGLDFAYFQRDDRASIQGIEIYAILSGTVALTLEDNYPYGYTVMIETPLKSLPEDMQAPLMEGYLAVPDDVEYQYNCPDVPTPTLTGEYSLYHLSAHMEAPPNFERGDPVTCGQLLGTVGTTGWSSNPHLHLETRLGPSGLDIPTMAHYEVTATEEQMSNYCLWRSSGYYQVVDPFLFYLFTED
jgi:murein DD-endopeptidase MepM/ murein hydrolase activator NlpD